MSKARGQLIALLEPAVEALGYELVDLEANFSGRRGTLRLYIDSPGGIRVEDCEAVSRQVSGVLDVEDPIRGDYNLEVSSPGLDRKLVKPAHFDRFAGHAVSGRLKTMIDGRRRITGTLLGREGDVLLMRVDGVEMRVPLDEVDVIRLVPEF
jgi:ribosome maturation factor RimP